MWNGAGSGSGRRRFPTGLLAVSSLLVLVVAVGFDIAADEPPIHTLAVAAAALVVGLGRMRWPGRFRGLAATVNLAVIGQPAVHALGKVSQAGAEHVSHSHGWPEGFAGIALHVAVALLVVAVAVLEPAGVFVAPRVLPLLRGLTLALPVIGPVSTVLSGARAPVPRVREQRLLFARQRRRRGPPAALLLAA